MPEATKQKRASMNLKKRLAGSGEVAFLVCLTLATALVWMHFDWLWRSVGVAAPIAAFATMDRWLKGGPVKRLSGRLQSLLRKPRVALGLWSAGLVMGVGSLSVASLHVNTTDQEPVWIVLMEQLEGRAAPRDSVLLDPNTQHASFLIALPWNRRLWFRSGDHQRTPTTTVRPWTAPVLAYPQRFDPASTVALLAAPRLLRHAGTGRPLHIVVTDSAGHAIARDSLTQRSPVPSLLLSVARPPAPDSQAAQRWLRLRLERATTAVDSAHAREFTDWMRAQEWLRARRDLVEGELLRVFMITQEGDTVVKDTIRVHAGVTDAIIVERSP